MPAYDITKIAVQPTYRHSRVSSSPRSPAKSIYHQNVELLLFLQKRLLSSLISSSVPSQLSWNFETRSTQNAVKTETQNTPRRYNRQLRKEVPRGIVGEGSGYYISVRIATVFARVGWENCEIRN